MLNTLWYGVEVGAQGLSVHSTGLSERLWGLRVDSDTMHCFRTAEPWDDGSDVAPFEP
jgi:hypothetical protein